MPGKQSLKASCDGKKQARVQTQSFLDSAEAAWSTRRTACKKLASQRQASMCAFGTKAKAKCSSEAIMHKAIFSTHAFAATSPRKSGAGLCYGAHHAQGYLPHTCLRGHRSFAFCMGRPLLWGPSCTRPSSPYMPSRQLPEKEYKQAFAMNQCACHSNIKWNGDGTSADPSLHHRVERVRRSNL